MSLVCNRDAYRAYCNLCFYTDQIPLLHDKWKKRFCSTSIKQNRTVEDVQKELDEIREYV